MASKEGNESGPPSGKGSRLPPPAFPPGTRRTPVTRSKSGDGSGAESTLADELPEGAFISPDEPIRRIEGDFPDEAFISPDEPIEHRQPLPGRLEEDPEVVITGIGSREPSYYKSVASLGAEVRDVSQVAQVLEDLAKRVREDGAAALYGERGLSSFEAGLRGFLAGYLARTRD